MNSQRNSDQDRIQASQQQGSKKPEAGSSQGQNQKGSATGVNSNVSGNKQAGVQGTQGNKK